MSGKTFEQVEIGEALGPQELVVSRERTRQYASICGMNAGRFHDDEEARKEGLPGMIVPGNLSLGLLSKMVTDWLGESGRLIRIGTTYRTLVMPDRKLALMGFVTGIDKEKRRAEIDVWIENEDAERLVIGTATAEFPPA